MKNQLHQIIFLCTLLFSIATYAQQFNENQIDNSTDTNLTKASQELTTSDIIHLLKQQLNHITGIELLIADGGKDSPSYSKFGHAVLRLIGDQKDWTQDLILSFSAQIPGPKKSIIKGLTGGYRSQLTVGPFAEVWEQYIKEGRQIRRKIIQTDTKQRNYIISKTIEILQNDNLPNYTFFRKNCAMLMAQFLSEILGLPDLKVIIPSHFPRILERRHRSFLPDVVIADFSDLEKKLSFLGINKKMILSGIVPDSLTLEPLLNILSDKDLKFLDQITPHNGKLSRLIANTISYKTGATLEEALGVQEMPQVVYEVCATNDCRELQVKKLYEFLGEIKFAAWKKYFTEEILFEARRSQLPKSYRNQDPYFINMAAIGSLL